MTSSPCVPHCPKSPQMSTLSTCYNRASSYSLSLKFSLSFHLSSSGGCITLGQFWKFAEIILRSSMESLDHRYIHWANSSHPFVLQPGGDGDDLSSVLSPGLLLLDVFCHPKIWNAVCPRGLASIVRTLIERSTSRQSIRRLHKALAFLWNAPFDKYIMLLTYTVYCCLFCFCCGLSAQRSVFS